MIQQQRTGGSLSGEFRRAASTYGVRGLYRGFVSALLPLYLPLSFLDCPLVKVLWALQGFAQSAHAASI